MHNNGIKIIIAGGKTGGHLFPGIAIAQALKRKDELSKILFVGTGEKFEVTTLEKYGFPHTKISCNPIKGKSIKDKFYSVLHLPVSIAQAIKIIKEFHPDIVIGVGGYSAGPVVLGARFCKVITAIHEQNSIPGLTNRILSKFVHVIFTSFENTRGFPKTKTIFCFGNPVRRSEIDKTIRNNTKGNEKNGIDEIQSLKEKNADFTILVTGGSQGASSINRAFLDAVALMKKSKNFNHYKIIHQTGTMDEKMVIREYEKMGVKIKARAFFDDMSALQDRADLIICRAGAGTLSEISIKGKPSILIPYPYAANDHQRYNAEFFVDKGGAWMMNDNEITGKKLKDKIEFAKKNPEELELMACAAKSLSMPFADDNIVLKCIEMAGL